MQSSRKVSDYFVFLSGHPRTQDAVKRVVLDQLRRKTLEKQMVDFIEIDPPLDFRGVEPCVISGGLDAKVKYYLSFTAVTCDYRANRGAFRGAKLVEATKVARLYSHGPCDIYVTEFEEDQYAAGIEILASRYVPETKRILAIGREVALEVR